MAKVDEVEKTSGANSSFTPKKVVLSNGEIAFNSIEGVLVRSPNYLDEAGNIKWPEADGFVVDSNGKAITFDANLKSGQIIDRYGDARGRFTSPLMNGEQISYDSRGLPYLESTMDYHRYEVVKDINFENMAEGFEQLSQLDKTELSILMERYNFSLADMANVQKGTISEVFGSGGGLQIKFESSVDWYEKLGLIREIK
ncbi:MAG: TNT domain-containing protein [Sporolactobacillus sp.]